MPAFERKYNFETNISNNEKPSLWTGLEPDAEYLSPDSIYSVQCTTYLNSHLVSLFHLLPCRATDGSSVPQYCAHMQFPWLLESTLIRPGLLELVILLLYDAF